VDERINLAVATNTPTGIIGAECSDLKEKIPVHSAVIAWQLREMEMLNGRT